MDNSQRIKLSGGNDQPSKESILRSQYLIPILVSCDFGVKEDEYQAALSGVVDVVRLSGSNRQILSLGNKPWASGDYSSVDWYLSRTKSRGNQIDASQLQYKLLVEPWQEYPKTHLDVVIVSRDIYVQNLNWCFGSTRENQNSVQSVFRFRGEERQVKLDLIKRTLRHETGHLLGIPGLLGSHPRIYEKGGAHCNHLCTMRQGWSLAEFKSQMMEEQKAGVIFCQDCLNELRLIQSKLKPV